MRIRVIGGGPAGLYFAILMKRDDPSHDVRVFERSRRDATWGFGVVFSDRALEFLRADDEEMHRYLAPHMETWSDLTIVHRDTRVPISGNGFAAIGRLRLLNLLHDRADALGIPIAFETNVRALADVGPADLFVAADGASSFVRRDNEGRLGTTVDGRRNRFVWYGTSQRFETLTLTFRTNEHGVFCAHHYRYAPHMSTFLVEVDEATFERAGLASMGEAETIRYCERVFAPELGGHPILSNSSTWRTYAAVWNERFGFDRVALLGDALRTVHFSIGSGTRLAMEDAVALFKAWKATGDVPRALARYEELRRPPARKIWDAANVSLRWYEGMASLMALDPVDLAYAYMVRTGRVSHADVRRMDRALAEAYERRHPEVAKG